jgi:hypothetical protein
VLGLCTSGIDRLRPLCSSRTIQLGKYRTMLKVKPIDASSTVTRQAALLTG